MTKNLDFKGLESIADSYDLFYIDLWGVVHNGINLHEQAITVLKELLKNEKMFVLLTNAPRPNETVRNFLYKMGMDKDLRKHVFTSGEAALNYLKKSLTSKASSLVILTGNVFTTFPQDSLNLTKFLLKLLMILR